MTILLLGIDCATQPAKTGIALGVVDEGRVCIRQCAVASRTRSAASMAVEWLAHADQVVIALDAPLGWPRPLAASLIGHRAGQGLPTEAQVLFARATDRAIRERLGKQPLEVGANLIARTAVAALALLDELRELTGRPIPLAWEVLEAEPWRAIEVYPAATRIAHGAPDRGGCLEGLGRALDCRAVEPAHLAKADAVDACVCVLAAADFLLGRSVPPDDLETAVVEGWIWAPAAGLGSGSGGETRAVSDAERVAAFVSLCGIALVKELALPYHHMGATITDAVLQSGLCYETVVRPRVQHVMSAFPEANTTSAFLDLVRERGGAEVVQWSHPEKLRRMEGVAELFISEGVETEADLRDWLCGEGPDCAANAAKLAAVRGVGPKTIDYLKILCGEEETAAVDVHLLRFLEQAGVRAQDYESARTTITQAAGLLGVSVACLDHSIWMYMSRGKQMT